MPRILIQGAAAVFHGDTQVTDPVVLRSHAGIEYDEELFTDYIGGTAEEDELATVLDAGGRIKFDYREGEDVLVAITAYRSHRPLSDAELRLLVEYTMGQWSDGIGENWTCESADKCGYTIMCLTPCDGAVPVVKIIAE